MTNNTWKNWSWPWSYQQPLCLNTIGITYWLSRQKIDYVFRCETITRSAADPSEIAVYNDCHFTHYMLASGKAKAEEGLVSGSVGSPGAAGSQLPCPSPARPGRALINPFDPSHVTIKLTSNRRRWSHIFPKGMLGFYVSIYSKNAQQATLINLIWFNNNVA